jgi:hypothetical protein
VEFVNAASQEPEMIGVKALAFPCIDQNSVGLTVNVALTVSWRRLGGDVAPPQSTGASKFTH